MSDSHVPTYTPPATTPAPAPFKSTSPNTRDLVDLMALSHVPRWVILPMLRHQTVAEHSYRVTIIVAWMTAQIHRSYPLPDGGPDYMGPNPWAYSMAHDVEECRTGDIPGPAKRHMASAGLTVPLNWSDEQMQRWARHMFGNPDDAFRLRLKLADLLEAYTWLQKWGLDCDHKRRVLVELWEDTKDVCGKLEHHQYPKPAIGWFSLAHLIRDALVYERR